MKELRSYNILFLEDNEGFANTTMEFLQMFFNEVYHCKSIADAKKLYAEHPIHLIISDVRVEDGNGLDFLAHIRKKDKAIQMVVISAHKEEDYLFQAISLGLLAYKIKPLSFDDYVEIFETALPKIKASYAHKILIKDGTYYDSLKKSLDMDGTEVVLSKKESEFIELLLQNKEQILTKEKIQEQIWGETVMTEAALKNFILRIRKKTYKSFIKTIPELGFLL